MRILREHSWFFIMSVFSLAGFAAYIYDNSMGSWLMGIGAGIGITILLPIFHELVEISTPLPEEDSLPVLKELNNDQ